MVVERRDSIVPFVVRLVVVPLGYKFAIAAERPMPAHVVALAQPNQRPLLVPDALHQAVYKDDLCTGIPERRFFPGREQKNCLVISGSAEDVVLSRIWNFQRGWSK